MHGPDPLGRSHPAAFPVLPDPAAHPAALQAERTAIVTQHQTATASGSLDWRATTGMLDFTPPNLPRVSMGYSEFTAQTGAPRRLSVLRGEAYLREVLRFPAPPGQPYRLGIELAHEYDWSPWPPLADWEARQSYPDAIPALISAFEQNPDLRVKIYHGTTDLTVAAARTAHACERIPDPYRGNVETYFYPSGHKLHMDPDIQARLLADSQAA